MVCLIEQLSRGIVRCASLATDLKREHACEQTDIQPGSTMQRMPDAGALGRTSSHNRKYSLKECAAHRQIQQFFLLRKLSDSHLSVSTGSAYLNSFLCLST